jgi:PAS domain S-box-containing protein/putative nucleotidyltransferase with HDIG domain
MHLGISEIEWARAEKAGLEKFDAIIHSEERFRVIFEYAPDAYYMTDLKGVFIEGNRATEKLTGYERDEIIGKSFSSLSLLSRPQIPKAAALLVKNALGRPTGPDEFVLRTRDGHQMPVEISTYPMKLNSRGIVLGIAHDISERKRAEKSLSESEERFRNVFKEAPIGMAMADLTFHFFRANAAFCRMLGYREPELANLTFRDITHQDQISFDMENIRKLSAGEIPSYETEKRYVRKDGKILWGRLTLKMFSEEGGAARYYLAMIEDVTERKEAADALLLERKNAENEAQKITGMLRETLGHLINVVATTVEVRDPYTAGHQKRVSNLARAIATEMALPKDQIEGIRVAGVIHDIGKISIPSEILSKPGKLSDIELALISTHSQVGYKILKDIKFPWPIAQIVYQHHERLNGSGYPRRLKGGAILLEARILAVADVMEAMSSHRPYRSALGVAKALEEISANKGRYYDPDVVEACVRIFSDRKFKFDA